MSDRTLTVRAHVTARRHVAPAAAAGDARRRFSARAAPRPARGAFPFPPFFSSWRTADHSLRSCPPRQVHVEEGAMVCPNCQHVYPISNGIPNMVRAPIPIPIPIPTRDVPKKGMLIAPPTAPRRARNRLIVPARRAISRSHRGAERTTKKGLRLSARRVWPDLWRAHRLGTSRLQNGPPPGDVRRGRGVRSASSSLYR